MGSVNIGAGSGGGLSGGGLSKSDSSKLDTILELLRGSEHASNDIVLTLSSYGTNPESYIFDMRIPSSYVPDFSDIRFYDDRTSPYKYTPIRKIIGLPYLISHLNTMERMFSNVTVLESVDSFSGFDGSSILSLLDAFENTSISELDFSNSTFSSATTMKQMCYNADKLISFNAVNSDFSSVADMSEMFYDSNSLTTIDFSDSNLSSIMRLDYFCYGCGKLSTLDFSGATCSQKLTNLNQFACNCKELLDLDLSGFAFDDVDVNLTSFCYGCSKLRSLKFPTFNNARVTSLKDAFSGCYNLKSVDLRGADMSNLSDMQNAFQSVGYEISKSDIYIPDIKTENLTSLESAFAYIPTTTVVHPNSPQSINVPNATDTYKMFFNTTSPETIVDVSKALKTSSKLTSISAMFRSASCGNRYLDLSGIDVSSVDSMQETFREFKSDGCIDFDGWNTSNVTYFSGFMQSIGTISGNASLFIWIPSSFVATNASSKPFSYYTSGGNVHIYTNVEEDKVAAQNWGDINSDFTMHYGSTHDEFVSLMREKSIM
jgi:hypothetical protein